MADEENQKPEDQQVPETALETEPESVEDNAAAPAPESVQEEATEAAPEGSEEAIEAIAENVKNRAAEIEDVLAEVSEPSALPKTTDQPQTTAEKPTAPVKAYANEADDEDEPNLAISVSGETLRISTAHPLIEDIAEQLQKSQRFTLFSIGALCIALLAAVLFYVLMAAQLSSKVKEIDSMLGAMAKRTLQMTKGIESFSTLETQIDQGLANQLMLQEMLAANEISMVALNRQLEAMPNTMGTSTKDALSETQQALRVQLQNLETETSSLLTKVERAQRSLDEQSTAVGSLKGIRRELAELKGGLNNVEQTVSDLYVIERARVAKQMRDRGPVALSE